MYTLHETLRNLDLMTPIMTNGSTILLHKEILSNYDS